MLCGHHRIRCASGCVVQCRICNQEVAGSNLDRGYSGPRSTQPSISPGSVNEYQLYLGRQRQVWLILIMDERVGVQTARSLRTRVIPERFCGGSLQRGAIPSVCTFTGFRRPCTLHVTAQQTSSPVGLGYVYVCVCVK